MEQLTLLPSPLLFTDSPILSALVFDVTQKKTNQSTWTSLFFLPLLLPLPVVPYISPAATFSGVYNVLPHSRQKNGKRRRERRMSGYQR